jgi:hypothetical protein
MSQRSSNSNNAMDTEDSDHVFTAAKFSAGANKKKRKPRRRNNKKKTQTRHVVTPPSASLASLPREIIHKIFGYCDRPSLEALKLTLPWFSRVIEEEGLLWEISPKLNLDQLPSELLLTIFAYLSRCRFCESSFVPKS